MKNFVLIFMSVLLSFCFTSCVCDNMPEINFYVVKFSDPKYSEYVMCNHDKFIYSYDYTCDSTVVVNSNLGVYVDYLNGSFPSERCEWNFVEPLTDFSDFEPNKFFISLSDGYFLQYPFFVLGDTVLYGIKWTELESFDVDLSRYDTLCINPVIEKYRLTKAESQKTLDDIVRYCNKTIESGNVSSARYIDTVLLRLSSIR